MESHVRKKSASSTGLAISSRAPSSSTKSTSELYINITKQSSQHNQTDTSKHSANASQLKKGLFKHGFEFLPRNNNNSNNSNNTNKLSPLKRCTTLVNLSDINCKPNKDLASDTSFDTFTGSQGSVASFVSAFDSLDVQTLSIQSPPINNNSHGAIASLTTSDTFVDTDQLSRQSHTDVVASVTKNSNNSVNTEQTTDKLVISPYKTSHSPDTHSVTTNTITMATADREQQKSLMRELMEEMRGEWKKLIDDSVHSLKEDLKTELTKDIKELDKSQKEMRTEVDTTKAQLNGCKIQVGELTDIVHRQDQIIKECKSHIESLQANVSGNKLFISGIVFKKEETYEQAVTRFFKDIMKIEEAIPLNGVYKTGPSKASPLKVELTYRQNRGKIFSYSKNLSGVLNQFERSYSIDAEQPPRIRANRRKIRAIRATNASMPEINQLSLEVKNGKLHVDGGAYQDPIKPPSVSDILRASKELRLNRSKMPITKGNLISIEGSDFIGYSA